LHEEHRTRAVDPDEDGDEDEERRERKEAGRRENEIEQPLLRDLKTPQRHTRELQAGERVEPRQLDGLELVQNLFGPEMNFDRKRQESLGAAFNDLGSGPGHQQEDRIGLEAADAGDSLGKIALERRGGCRDRGEKAAADDTRAERPRFVAVDEGADGADEEDALRGDEAGRARERRQAHDREAQHDQSGNVAM
jgi:hypothetical protein